MYKRQGICIIGEVVGYTENTPKSYDLCLLYTSDAADELDGVDLGGRRIIKKKKPQALHL
ncbi:hypothetical protein JMUB7518_28030 [Staphylococcus aureus]